MSPLPTEPSLTGESWEVIETTRSRAAAELDALIESVKVCDCGHAADGLEHYDALHTYTFERYLPLSAGVFPALLAEAVTRLAAARKDA